MAYKSKGEEAIAKILTDYKVEFVYEHPLLIKEQKENDGEKLRIWYPDFWLPKYSIIIEYFGLEGNEAYDKGKKAKWDAYKRLNLDCIPVYPETLNKDLKGYILKKISEKINDKRRHFDNR